MKIITTEELINYKILPFNIYSETGDKLYSAGEVLTPGKLLQLKNLNQICRDDEETLDIETDEEEIAENRAMLQRVLEKDKEREKTRPKNKNNEDDVEDNKHKKQKKSSVKPIIQKTESPTKKEDDLDKIFDEYAKNSQRKEKVLEGFDMNPTNQTLKSNTVVDDIALLNYKGPINRSAKIDPQNQIKIKAFFYETMSNIHKRTMEETANLFLNIRDKILQDIIYRSGKVIYSSQIKLIGEYQKCHSLNVAILSGLVAKAMDLSESTISDIVLAGLLHDIGKTRLDSDLVSKQYQTLSKQEQKMLELHTTIGYKMLSQEMKMPENIALIALEHHENNDGSGYPMGKSGDLISKESQIVHICNYFDNLSFNKTHHLIKNSKDAARALLTLGSKYFLPEALYTFIHMFSYNDTMNFEDMVL